MLAAGGVAGCASTVTVRTCGSPATVAVLTTVVAGREPSSRPTTAARTMPSSASAPSAAAMPIVRPDRLDACRERGGAPTVAAGGGAAPTIRTVVPALSANADLRFATSSPQDR